MRTIKLWAFFLLCASAILISGCGDQLKDLKVQNDMQRRHIQTLESEVQAAKLQLSQLQRKLDSAQGISNTEKDALQQTIAALEEDLAKKKALIASMQQQLLYGGAQLPVELSTMLDDFAKTSDMITYDAARGVIKFKSDLLFETGSDNVAPSAANAVKALCEILNSKEAENFDIIIAGHTDDMRIGKPGTRAKHPTNWHLSAHRAISVLDVMTASNIDPTRLSIRGFGEFRPVEENKPKKQGNPKNRRVEIYIVAKGV